MLGSASQTSTVETFASVSYLEGYLENAEYLPTELQYYITHYRELACQIKEIVADITKYIENVAKSVDASQKKQAILQIQRCLIKQNELGDQKLNIMTLIGDLIESKIRDHDVDEHFDVQPQTMANNVSSLKEEEIASVEKESKSSVEIPACPSTRSSSNKVEEKHDSNNMKRKRHGRHRSSTQEQICLREDDKKDEDERPRKKKTRKDSKVGEKVPNFKIIGNIDPNEPVYCSCREVSYGEMIGCDNDNCAIEWFHFRCVELNHKPKGKWYCPTCRGDKSGVMNPELVEQQKRAKKNASAMCSD